MSGPPEATPEEPSRYTRSFGGMFAAMIVTVLFVAAYVGFRALTRDQPDVRHEVDYLACVSELQGTGVTVVYPRSLPSGWTATSASFERGTPPHWGIGILTDDDEFVGIRQEAADVDDLLATYVDKHPRQGGDATPANALGVASWQTWSDPGGDHAFSATLDSGPLAGQTLLVYGSAAVADQEALIDLLALDPQGVLPGRHC